MAVLPPVLEILKTASACYPGFGPGAVKLKAVLCANALANPSQARNLLAPSPGSSLANLLRRRPEARGVLVWPFQCSDWSVKQRLDRFLEHYRLADELDEKYQFGVGDKLQLLDLSEQSRGVCVILDQPSWFMREGGYTLNLFLDDFRAYSIAFALFEPKPGDLALYVGGIQGRDREEVLDIYRAMTKAFHGMRPRDLLIENLRLFAKSIGATQIICVGEERRHHRHHFFGGKAKMGSAYDPIWEDRGGVRMADGDFDLPLTRPAKPLESVPAKKRSLYRKRYEFLEQIGAVAERQYQAATAVRFDAI